MISFQPVSLNPEHIEVDIPALSCVGAETKPQGISPTLGNTNGIVCLLSSLSLLCLARVKVSLFKTPR